MIKVLSIVGTRPQFLKLAPLCKQLINFPEINHIIVHTGQHYDDDMSKYLFEVLSIPNPNYLLNINGGSHAEITGRMMVEIEKILIKEKPNLVLVYGDCDTTLAGALVAKKLELLLVHIESGMRSFNKTMPEEVNRVVTDHISDILLCSTHDSVTNLEKENINKNIHYVGNLQVELLKMCLDTYHNTEILEKNNLIANNFVLLTIHRHYNTTVDRIKLIFKELCTLEHNIIFPIHPRTRNLINKENILVPKNIIMINPVNYLDMVILESKCRFIITDSGGVQPEAWFLNKKCLVIRTETEWTDEIKSGNNKLFNFETSVKDTLANFLNEPWLPYIENNSASLQIIQIISRSRHN